MLAVLIQIDGYDPVADAAVTLRACNVDDPAVCHLDGQTWWPAIAKAPVLRYDLFDGAFAGQIVAPSSALTLRIEPWADFGRYALADARIRIWTGVAGGAWGGYTLRFDGRLTAQPQTADGQAQVAFAVDDRWLDDALLATYAGTTGVEGPEAMKGQAKPLALGAPRYIAGKLIDSVNSVFQLSGHGAIRGVEAVLEKLARFGASTGNYASYAALIAADVPAGRWATCNAAGLVRLGAPPAGQISFLMQGDTTGPDGWARRPGQMIRRLALLSGGVGKIDDASLNALDAARPYNLSLYIDAQTTARQLVQAIAASVNAVALVSWTGQLFVVPVAIGTPAASLAADGSSLPPVSSVAQIEVSPPFKSLGLSAERAWTVHALSDIAFTAPLIPVGDYDASTVYREGNIVTLTNGAQYLYIATTPMAGHAPPDPTFWAPLATKPVVDWTDQVTGPGKPDDNATNSADPNSPFGGSTIKTAQEQIDEALTKVDGVLAPDGSIQTAIRDAASKAGAAVTTSNKALTAATDAGGAVSDLSRQVTLVSDGVTGVGQSVTKLSAFANGAPNLAPSLDKWTLASGFSYSVAQWGASIYGSTNVPSGTELVFAQSPKITWDGATPFTLALDLLGFPGPISADVQCYKADGSNVGGSLRTAFQRNGDYRDGRPRTDFSTTYTPPASTVYLIIRVLAGGGQQTGGFRMVKLEHGSTPTAYSVEGEAASLGASVTQLSGALSNQEQSLAQYKVDVAARFQTADGRINSKADATVTTQALATLDNRTQSYVKIAATAGGQTGEIDVVASDGSSGSFSILAFKAGRFVFSGGDLIVGTVRARAFVTDAGVDLAAIVPGSLNWRTSGAWSGGQAISPSASFGPVASTGGGTIDGHRIAGTIAVTGFRPANGGPNNAAQAAVYLSRYINGSWVQGDYLGDIAFAGATLTRTLAFSFFPGWSGKGVALAVTLVVRDASSSDTLTVQQVTLSAENTVWK